MNKLSQHFRLKRTLCMEIDSLVEEKGKIQEAYTKIVDNQNRKISTLNCNVASLKEQNELLMKANTDLEERNQTLRLEVKELLYELIKLRSNHEEMLSVLRTPTETIIGGIKWT